MQQIQQLKRITSKRLTELLFAKKSGRITPEENEELGIYANNFANIILKTPKMQRFLFVYDEKGRFDLESEMRANIVITIIGTCPFTYEPQAGRSYSYCLYCANSAACEIIRRHKYRLKVDGAVNRIVGLWKPDIFPHLRRVRNENRHTGEKTNLEVEEEEAYG